MMSENQYELTGWGAPVTKDVTLPSGQVCLVRKLTMEDVLELDIINNIDSFTGELLGKETPKGKGKKKQTEEDELKGIMKLMGDKERFGSLQTTVDAVVGRCVLKPSILPKPEDGNYEEGKVYINVIDFADKMIIFTAVFEGLGDLSKFRDEQDTGVGDVEAIESAAPPALRARGAN